MTTTMLQIECVMSACLKGRLACYANVKSNVYSGDLQCVNYSLLIIYFYLGGVYIIAIQ